MWLGGFVIVFIICLSCVCWNADKLYFWDVVLSASIAIFILVVFAKYWTAISIAMQEMLEAIILLLTQASILT